MIRSDESLLVCRNCSIERISVNLTVEHTAKTLLNTITCKVLRCTSNAFQRTDARTTASHTRNFCFDEYEESSAIQ